MRERVLAEVELAEAVPGVRTGEVSAAPTTTSANDLCTFYVSLRRRRSVSLRFRPSEAYLKHPQRAYLAVCASGSCFRSS